VIEYPSYRPTHSGSDYNLLKKFKYILIDIRIFVVVNMKLVKSKTIYVE
jgi:hypothetical protein